MRALADFATVLALVLPWVLLLLLWGAAPRMPRACPLCRRPATRAVMGPFPIWACMRHHMHDREVYAPVLFGVWSWLAIRISDLLPTPAYAFLLCPDAPFWYPRALWASLAGRGVRPEE